MHVELPIYMTHLEAKIKRSGLKLVGYRCLTNIKRRERDTHSYHEPDPREMTDTSIFFCQNKWQILRSRICFQ